MLLVNCHGDFRQLESLQYYVVGELSWRFQVARVITVLCCHGDFRQLESLQYYVVGELSWIFQIARVITILCCW